ncbi:prepilin-type N-terminal cleavage/methylation domain-containing protein [Pseudomonas sp. REP124]|uniref:prepilin-type N-terminal cleavage/methylation domain-containing protein n=1 Tax=Pseudomonas sp. REP124 TaxID=2875731 RepID=UPI001CCED867|nr:prepilin-type N-terminal cleavage/methylation domain-containing protein [Pseudomonas sp. REP124]MBZ9782290.1 prepilin-type N-terminal cleavage/methylation domain-containing protein [Pseudomonas sp. REP124]
MSNEQRGFTLLELVIALAIFALLGLASWTLFDGVVRVQQGTQSHDRELRSLQRAVALIERDLLHITEQPIMLEQSRAQWQRGNWRNPLDQPRSERQSLSYTLDNGVLWRESRSEGALVVQRQKLLDDVRHLSWRLLERQGSKVPGALEVQLSAGRFEGVRRVLLLPGALP